MLTTSRKQVYEKIITSKEGVLYRVWIAVSNECGKCRVELIKAIPIQEIKKEDLILLETSRESQIVLDNYLDTKREIISPFYSLIYINGSIPRAPTI